MPREAETTYQRMIAMVSAFERPEIQKLVLGKGTADFKGIKSDSKIRKQDGLVSVYLLLFIFYNYCY